MAAPNRARSSRTPDYAEFSKFYDHYLPRVLAFAQRRTGSPGAAERLTEAILVEVVGSGDPLVPGPAADAALIAAARRVSRRGPSGA